MTPDVHLAFLLIDVEASNALVLLRVAADRATAVVKICANLLESFESERDSIDPSNINMLLLIDHSFGLNKVDIDYN